ncbi:ATP-grasp domain-containing protein [Candidatus Gracilibacteria bacterium]|nr:ATP-grasp domain-containing protein [Candidatus Gracilibacteria bacterium]
MKVIDFKQDESLVLEELNKELINFFNKETLVINDTRAMIIPEVLPHIEFVCTYDQRILPMIENTNIVFSKPFSKDYLKYLNDFGLGINNNIFLIDNNKNYTLGENILLSKELIENIKKHNFKYLIPFFVDENMEKLSNILGIPLLVSKEIFEKANNKLMLKEFLISNNLPTLPGEITGDLEIILSYFNSKKRYLFKDPLGVSGYGFWDNKVNTIDELKTNFKNKKLIIEEFIEKIGSPSVQFFINKENNKSIIFGITDQILEDGKVYLGNTSPSIYLNGSVGDELIKQSKEIIKYISSLGYVGFGGIDFIIDNKKNIFATEVNARFTGATYPALTSLKLYNSLLKSWEFYNHELSNIKIIDFLEKKCIKNKNQTGIFPLSISGLENFKKINLLNFN